MLMRTTLTLDDDVAAQLERLRRTRDVSLKELVNEILRRGLKDLSAPPKRREPFHTQVVTLGRPRQASLDNVEEILAIAEGDSFK